MAARKPDVHQTVRVLNCSICGQKACAMMVITFTAAKTERESLNDPVHADFRDYMDRLNEVYLNHPALWEKDYEKQAFRWISEDSHKTALFAFLRNAREETVLNFTDRRRAFRHALLKQAEYLMDTHAVHAEDEAVKEEAMMEPYQGILFRIEQ